MRRVKQKAKQEPVKRPRTLRWVLVAALIATGGWGGYQWLLEHGLPMKADLQFAQVSAGRTISKDGVSLIQYRLEVKAKGLGNKMPTQSSILITVDGESHPVYGIQNITKESGVFLLGAVPSKGGPSEVEFKIVAEDADQGNNVMKVTVP